MVPLFLDMIIYFVIPSWPQVIGVILSVAGAFVIALLGKRGAVKQSTDEEFKGQIVQFE